MGSRLTTRRSLPFALYGERHADGRQHRRPRATGQVRVDAFNGRSFADEEFNRKTLGSPGATGTTPAAPVKTGGYAARAPEFFACFAPCTVQQFARVPTVEQQFAGWAIEFEWSLVTTRRQLILPHR